MNRSTIMRALHQAETRKTLAKVIYSTMLEADKVDGSDYRLLPISTLTQVYGVFEKNLERAYVFRKRLEQLDMFKDMRIHPQWRLFYYAELEGVWIIKVVSYRRYSFRIEKVTDKISRLIAVETENDDQWPVIECTFTRGDDSALSLKSAIENCRSRIDAFIQQLKREAKANPEE